MFRSHPNISKESQYSFNKFCLLGLASDDLKRQFKIDINLDVNPRRYDFFNTGCWYAPEKEKNILEKPLFYIQNEPSFHKKWDKYISPQRKAIVANLQALKKIIFICKNNHIVLKTFITPHNHNMLNEIYFNDYIAFISALSSITNYWDFSGYNSVTTNNENYYEYSHYRPKVSELIAGRIFYDTNLSIPSDFGVFVTQKMLKQHLSDLKRQREDYIRKEQNGSL